MPDYARENLLRLMAGAGLSIRGVADRTGLDERTIRGILGGGKTPHAQTLHRLAEGLGVKVDEFFVDPAQLALPPVRPPNQSRGGRSARNARGRSSTAGRRPISTSFTAGSAPAGH